METWIEVQDTFLTNQPLIWTGKGRGRHQIPDPGRPPTEAYLFCYKARYTLKRRRVQRSEFIQTIAADTAEELNEAVLDFVSRHVLIPDVPDSLLYMRAGQRSRRLNLEAAEAAEGGDA